MKFKLKVKTGGEGAAPGGSLQPSGAAQQQQDGMLRAPSQQWPPIAQPAPSAAQPLQPAPSKPFKLKLKVAPTAIQPKVEPPHQLTVQQWDQPVAAVAAVAPTQPAAPQREAPASGAGAPRAIKKIKLATGKPTGVPVGKKPVIKFKPPPKQPRDAAAAAVVNAGEPSRAAALPIVRLTLPTVGPVVGGGGLKRPKAKAPKGKPGAKPGGGPRKKRRLADDDDFDDDFSLEGAPAARRPKRSRSELKELRDLGIDDLEDFDPDEPVAPRTFHLRSSHARGADPAPSSTGLGLSAGVPAPSDARTGAGGGAIIADTAGTEAREDTYAAAPAAKLPPVPSGPVGPPRKEDFERLLARCQKKDVHSMFKEPVTEAIAPGYFSVIKRPMDFSTMRSKAQRDEYDSWEALRADMRLMFSNALTYNAEGGNVHNYAKLLMGQCDRIVELAMQGKTDFRSSATITRKHNAAVKAQQRAEREALRAKARAEQRAAQEAKVLKKAGLESSYDEGEDENIRNSFRRPVRDANMARWRGLGAGCNAEGVAWGPGREVLRPVNPWLPPGMYALSLARFAAGLSGRARELVLRRARASTAADEAAERALQQELAKKVVLPPPPPPPPPAPTPPAAPPARPAGTAGMPAGSMPPATVMAQQQLLMQAAAAGRPQGMAGMLPGRPAGLPPGATITLMATPSGMVPFLIQPGQPPIMMMAPGMQPGMLPGGAGAKPGAPGMIPGMLPGLMPGMAQPAARPPKP